MANTPGPWKINTKQVQNGYKFDIEVPLCLIGTVYGSTNAMWDFVPGARQGEANARLIAAAPDLLDALKRLLVEHEDWINDEYNGTGLIDDLMSSVDYARAAIAKAIGIDHD